MRIPRMECTLFRGLARSVAGALLPLFLLVSGLACDDKSTHSTPDADVDVPDGDTLGDGDTDAGETCGNGLLDPDERCDLGILPGLPGACPEVCGDDDPCTTHFLTGVDCRSHCLVSDITNFIQHDGCCPVGGNLTNDLDCASICGNGVVEPGETCDPPGSCPTACDDGDVCTTDTLNGHADDCSAICSTLEILTCTSDDGCCPAGCNAANDDDCAATCDNGVVEPGETCDPPGSCPTACDDGDACTTNTLTGSAASCTATCAFGPVVACFGGDACCPDGCTANNDGDCTPVCGNSVVEVGETCDPPGSCPTTCEDGVICTTDVLSGDADDCDVLCAFPTITLCVDGDGCCPPACNMLTDDDCPATCNNGVVEPPETCDPPASCPVTCSDGDFCTADVLTGSAGNCDVTCTYPAIVACAGGDGCCPAGCNANNDSDCTARCDNGVVESGETCDPPASCPTLADCTDGDGCTTDLLTGSAVTCTAACGTAPVTACLNGDGCCPAGCNMLSDDNCSANCGNGVIEPGETCDPPGTCPTACFDGNACTTDTFSGSAINCNSACTYPAILACVAGDGCCPAGCNANNDTNCTPLCGNAVTEPGETCDPPGSCPTSCSDGDNCTADLLSGSALTCDVACTFPTITTCTGGDGCCPAGCNASNDTNCTPVCGNAVTEPGETCDPPASCPTSCSDGIVCTTDTLTGAAGSCTALCTFPAITACTHDDGCCPAGCNALNDDNCTPVCGNSVVEAGETCDPPASCPGTCSDGLDCTLDQLNGSSMTCDVSCSYPAITACTHDDGCCVAGCNALQDDDCPAVCGNTFLEPGETCDDGNLLPDDGCDETCHVEGLPTVFRVNWIALRDPHMFIRPLFTCYDCTDNAVLGNPSVNTQMNTNITTDEDADGLLDLSLVLVFRPLDQTALYTGPADAGEAACSAPMASTVCDVDPVNPLRSTTIANLGSGTCLAPYAGTVRPFTPAVTDAVAPPVCFTTDLTDIVLIISGTPVVLGHAQFAANYGGDPATQLIGGLIRGFMSEAQAQATQVDLGALGTRPLSDLLQPDACGTGDDRDYDLDGTTRGWWFYLNFTAVQVTWVGP